jgi:hypothetical protein
MNEVLDLDLTSTIRSSQTAQLFDFHELGPIHIMGSGARGRAPAATFSPVSRRSAVSSMAARPVATRLECSSRAPTP